MKTLAISGCVDVKATGCFRRLLGFDTTAEKVQAALNALNPGESYVIDGRVKGKITFGNITVVDGLFYQTRIVCAEKD